MAYAGCSFKKVPKKQTSSIAPKVSRTFWLPLDVCVFTGMPNNDSCDFTIPVSFSQSLADLERSIFFAFATYEMYLFDYRFFSSGDLI